MEGVGCFRSSPPSSESRRLQPGQLLLVSGSGQGPAPAVRASSGRAFISINVTGELLFACLSIKLLRHTPGDFFFVAGASTSRDY